MNRTRFVYALVAASAVLGGCGGGVNEGEFVQACMNQKGVQMVKVTEEMCRCAARHSRESLAPKLQQAMVLDMQGRKQESEALVADLSFDERAQFAMQQFEMIGACVVERE
jgi:hypothetical protein